jgi:hypothetical protein
MTSAGTRVCAIRVLAAIETWRRAGAVEPAVNAEGMPVDGKAWLAWHSDEFLPALFTMQEAIGEFNSALNRDTPVHPLLVKVDAENILAGKRVR